MKKSRILHSICALMILGLMMLTAMMLTAFPSLAQGAEKGMYVITFAGPIKGEWKTRIEEAGVQIGDYLPEHSFLVRMEEENKAEIEKLNFVSKIEPFSLPSSGTKALAPARSAGERARFKVTLWDREPDEALIAQIEESGGQIKARGDKRLIVEMTLSASEKLRGSTEVKYIEPCRPPRIFNQSPAAAIGAPRLWGLEGESGYTGKGEIIAITDAGLEADHPDLAAKLLSPVIDVAGDGNPGDHNGHGTHIAGSCLGSGTASNGRYKGVAWDSGLVFQALWDNRTAEMALPADLGTLFNQSREKGARIGSNSWGVECGGQYLSLSAEVDEFIYQHPEMTLVFAGGNQGIEGSIAAPATAKNCIAVGALESDNSVVASSSRGPATDGRIKPDMVAPGVDIVSLASEGGYVSRSGTSVSAALVAGSASLIRQYYREKHGHLPSAALIKATLINGADDLKLSGNDQGFGRVNLASLDQAIFFDDDPGHSLSTGDEVTFNYEIKDSSRPLKVTLVWTDYPGSPLASGQLVSDLDLEVISPDGAIYHGNGAIDRINNVEKVVILSPKAGQYTVKIKAYQVPMGFQDFALAVSAGKAVAGEEIAEVKKTGKVSINLIPEEGVKFSPIGVAIFRLVKTDDKPGYKEELIWERDFETEPAEVIEIEVPNGRYITYLKDLSTGKYFLSERFGMCSEGEYEVRLFFATNTHRWIVRRAADLVKDTLRQESHLDFEKEIKKALADGAQKEDEPVTRAANHFYNPQTNSSYFVDLGSGNYTAIEWASGDGAAGGYNEYDWTDAVRYYQQGKYTEAYNALGHVAHLLCDLAVPAHTHIDDHIGGEDFEKYCEDQTPKEDQSNLPTARNIISTSSSSGWFPADLFTDMAGESYNVNRYQATLEVNDAGTEGWASGQLAEIFEIKFHPGPGWTEDEYWELYNRMQDNPKEIGKNGSAWTTDDWWECDWDDGYYYIENTSDAYPYSGFYDGSKNLCQIYAAQLVPSAIQRTAGLLKYFYDYASTLPPIIDDEPDEPEVDHLDYYLKVWPGDTNNDGIVSEYDLIPLCKYMGETGPTRDSGGWTGESVWAWAPLDGATYADADGNGEVNELDVFPIANYYGMKHKEVSGTPRSGGWTVDKNCELQIIESISDSSMKAAAKAAFDSLSSERIPEPPTVVQVSPPNGATNVPPSTSIQVKFSLDMDASSMSSLNFKMKEKSRDRFVSGRVSYNSSTKTATFTPGSQLSHGTAYVVKVLRYVKSTEVRMLTADYSWELTTSPLVDYKDIREETRSGKSYTYYLSPSKAGYKIDKWDRKSIGKNSGSRDNGTYIDTANNRLVIKVRLDGHWYSKAYFNYRYSIYSKPTGSGAPVKIPFIVEGPVEENIVTSESTLGKISLGQASKSSGPSMGNEFSIPIMIGDVDDLGRASLKLQFDPARIRIVDVIPSDLGEDGPQISLVKTIDQANGQIEIAATIKDKEKMEIAPMSSEGKYPALETENENKAPIGVIVFTSVNGRLPNNPLSLTEADLKDSEGQNIPIVLANNILPGLEFPKATILSQNYPNPLNPETWIPFSLAEKDHVSIRIYNLSGQLIRTLDLGELEPGRYLSKDEAAYWDGKDEAGNEVASGAYLYQLQTNAATSTRKMIILK
ncbi:MAG: S8 family serine peptidase [bacterium]|nr:S8 family serine peptidase [bacterium]